MISLTQALQERLREIDQRLHPFIFTIHDWVSYFGDNDYLWPHYDASLIAIIKEQTSTTSVLTQSWIDHVINQRLDNNALLYRHYLLKDVFTASVDTSVTYPYLYQLIASTLTGEVFFGGLEVPELWNGIEFDPHPINRLRIQQPIIGTYLYTLAMQDDELPDQILNDHGKLSSVSLLYGMYLVYVIAIYEASLDSNLAMQQLVRDIHDTLQQLKGALCDGTNQWL